jgi:HSP20 family protein
MYVIPFARIPAPRAYVPATSRTLQRVLDQARGSSAERADTAPALLPTMDVAETDTHYRIVLDVPGATREQLAVTIEGRRVGITTGDVPASAKAAAPAVAPAADTPLASTDKLQAAPTVPAECLLYRERPTTARYARTVVLPADVDQAGSQARLEHGVLTLTLAKRVPTGATRISID